MMKATLKITFIALLVAILSGKSQAVTCYACDEGRGEYNCDSAYFPTRDLEDSLNTGHVCYVGWTF